MDMCEWKGGEAVVECVGDERTGGGILKPAVGAEVGAPLNVTTCMTAVWAPRRFDEMTLHCAVHLVDRRAALTRR